MSLVCVKCAIVVLQTGQFDIENGWGLDERNWAVLTAAENVVETAEQVSVCVHLTACAVPLTPSLL